MIWDPKQQSVRLPRPVPNLRKRYEATLMRGVLVCGSGTESALVNRLAHAANCSDVTMARLCRQHNDANVIAFGERLVGEEVALEALRVFLTTDFEGGRHAARVETLASLSSR